MKSFVNQILIVVLLVLAFVGCTGDNLGKEFNQTKLEAGDTGGLQLPITDQGTKISWFVISDVTTLNDSYVLQKMRELTGVDVELMISSPSVASEKAKVLVASKKLPNIMGTGLSDSEANDLSLQGAFAAVEDYIDQLPNFKKTFVDNEENSWIFKSYAAADGKLYGFYGYDWNREVNTAATLYRKDIFDKHGIKMWHSTEEFYEALKTLKKIYPNSTPYALKTQDNIFANLSTSWGITAHTPYYDEEKRIWSYSDSDSKYKDMLDFLRKLFQEGLIDPEFLTATQADWTSKMTQAEKAFVTTDWIGRMDMFKEQTKDMVPDYDLRFANPIGPKQTMKTLSQLCWPRYVANNENAETAFKLLDFCLSPKGAELITMGIEGETYKIGENGKAEYLDFENKVPEMNELLEKYGMFIEGMYLRFDRRSAYFNFSKRDQEAQDFAKNSANMEPADPILNFTQEEKKLVDGYLAALNKAGKEFSVKYIMTDDSGEKSWAAWTEKAKALGSEELVKIYNEAQKRYD